ncbi:hypothetical protein BGZ79_004105 [Entomortierella chlamydospora]|nr:hypothetical protein BGZ79_004105 [Entomortierella chlamydospora]
MDNLTTSAVNDLRPHDNDINPSELAHGHLAAPHVVINMGGPSHLSRSATVPPQNKTAPIRDTFADSRRAASSFSDPSVFWHFDETKHSFEATSKEGVTTRKCTIDCQLMPGFYNLDFGISTQSLHVSSLDSIVFYIGVDGDGRTKRQSQITEAITGKDMREFQEFLSSNINQTCKLKLHQQIVIDDQQQSRYKLNVKMETRLRPDASPEAKATPVLSIHYFALYECSETKAQGLPTRVHKMHAHKTYAHKPYVWSIDIQHCENPNDPVRPLKICRYSISGDGTRVATLSATDDSLDLWDISTPEGSAPHGPKNLAEKQFQRFGGRTHTDPHSSIAVSWDACTSHYLRPQKDLR